MTETITITVPTWVFFVFCGVVVFQGLLKLYALHLKCKIDELEKSK